MAQATSRLSAAADDVGRCPGGVRFAPDHGHGRADGGSGPLGLEVDVGGLRGLRDVGVGCLVEERGEGVVDPVDDRLDRAEVRRELDGAAGLRGEVVTSGEERADVGAAEPVDRLLRVADDEEPPGLDRHVEPLSAVRAAAGRRRRCARPARSGSGRCPGTRRAGDAGSAGAGSARTIGPWTGSRSTRRASTSRSWNSSVPASRRASAAARVCRRSTAPRWWAHPSRTARRTEAIASSTSAIRACTSAFLPSHDGARPALRL